MHTRIAMTAKKVLESKGRIPVSKAMLESGYPATTAKNPQQVTRTKSWQQLMEEALPDKDLLRVHKEGLSATKIITSPTEPDREVEDYSVRKGYLELGYKVKGRLIDTTINQQFNAENMKIEFE